MIGPDRRLKLSLLYPATTGRNFDEILRVVDSLQLTATRKVATPVDWKQGGSCMVVPGVKQEDTAGLFPKGVKVHEVPSGKVKLSALYDFDNAANILGLPSYHSTARVEGVRTWPYYGEWCMYWYFYHATNLIHTSTVQ